MKATAADVGRSFHEYLSRVMHGGVSVEITYHGRRAAVLNPLPQKMSGKEFVKLLRRHKPDPEAADAVAIGIKKIRQHERERLERIHSGRRHSD
jgi:prevent-host-death family protein